jgi:hypothetical protein
MTIATALNAYSPAKAGNRAASREEMRRELQQMSDAMVEEKGLLNHAQAALMLDVSTKRVGELVRQGKLTRFDFLGRTYVSMREIWARNQMELRAGRPLPPLGRRIARSLKAAVQTDSLQARLGGYAGPHVKAQHKEAKRKLREREKELWRKLTGKRKQ